MKKSRLFSFMASAALAVTSLGAAGFGASAAAGDVQPKEGTGSLHSVTITPADEKTHTYEAYQLFKGELTEQADETKVMTKIEWGASIPAEKVTKLQTVIAGKETNVVKTALTAYTPALATPYEASAFADFITANKATSGFAEALADIFNEVLTAAPASAAYQTTTSNVFDKEGTTGLSTGYYLIKDKDGTQNGENAAYTDFILKVVDDVTVASKSEVPTIDKKIKVGDDLKTGDTASIGDTITYQLNSKVPAMTGYDPANGDKYFFIVSDTMCQGLTFKNDVTITIDGTPYTGFYVKTKGDDDHPLPADSTKTFEIVFENFIAQKSKAGKDIVITYTAELNDQCDRTTTGNPNSVNLTYSNNPNQKYQGTTGTPDEPNSAEKDVMGITPNQITKVYTTGIRIKKVDEKGAPLPGAKFILKGNSANKVFTSATTFTEAADGAYYLLNNGSYTQTPPEDSTKSQYAVDGDNNYKRFNMTTTDTAETSTVVPASGLEATVDSNGYLVFSGLGDGSYTIQETEAPAGYNLDPTEYTFVIGSNPTKDAPNWTVDGAAATPSETNGWTVITKEVTNKKGIILPATGGIGTVIFYVVGSLLIGAAGVLFVTKRKKTAKEK
ncbi:MAG: isopeptide-forming domain-containing fimbrial protein [Oscillospiraceae bacterium]|nr:isopeptide-forming domain-containing fimbrial protein [Oscillospiraceae bacterium]